MIPEFVVIVAGIIVSLESFKNTLSPTVELFISDENVSCIFRLIEISVAQFVIDEVVRVMC